ncbi:ketosteroid isomerase-like protein [Streptacidiphilus sp. MAP12-20]|uniref:nuclear transport factor 2 family protein n=1 Tax=Streptacidiphilus sp. MAP12-20 TaxID=3156299 RepID=UPI003519CF30
MEFLHAIRLDQVRACRDLGWAVRVVRITGGTGYFGPIPAGRRRAGRAQVRADGVMTSDFRQSKQLSAFRVSGMTQENRELVQNAWRAFASGDADRISAFFTEDAEWRAPAGNATAVALDVPSHMVGNRAIAHFIAEDVPRLFVQDVSVTFAGLYADGDCVVVEETMSATLAGGNSYVNDYCFVFVLKDGLIHRVREYMDTARGHRMVFGEASS